MNEQTHPVQRNRRLLLPLSTTGWLLAKPSLCISIVKVVEKTKQFDPSSYAPNLKRYEGANLVRSNDKPSSPLPLPKAIQANTDTRRVKQPSRMLAWHPIVYASKPATCNNGD